jgi:hypothetical protein
MEAIVSRCIAGEEYDLPECPIVIANDKWMTLFDA